MTLSTPLAAGLLAGAMLMGPTAGAAAPPVVQQQAVAAEQAAHHRYDAARRTLLRQAARERRTDPTGAAALARRVRTVQRTLAPTLAQAARIRDAVLRADARTAAYAQATAALLTGELGVHPTTLGSASQSTSSDYGITDYAPAG